MTNCDNQLQAREHMMKKFASAKVPWPEMVADYLLGVHNVHTRRSYSRYLKEWLPCLDAPTPWDIELVELVKLKKQVLDDGRSAEIHRQAFAALLGCFQFFREQFPYNKFEDESIERLFGSDAAYRRRKAERLSQMTYEEAEEQGLV